VKKLGREPRKLETLNLFSLLQRDDGSTLYDPGNHASFFAQVNSGLTEALDSESTLHGMRIQSLFAGMVANLGKAQLLKEEDSGVCYYEGDDLCLPDFRIVTTSGDVMLVETKNHFSKKGMSPFRIRRSDLDGLERYAKLVGTPLKIAVYWAGWNLWTLNDAASFAGNRKYAELEFRVAAMQSEMAALGDFMIGTKYPLVLRLIAATDKPRSISADGVASIHFKGFEIRCADTLIEDKTEQNIALYLMMYGKWEYDGGYIEFDDSGLPAAAVHTVSPDEITPNQGFEIIGSLSSLYSQLYNALTLEEGKVTRLRLTDPTAIAPIIPLQHEKKSLPLWRFVQTANI